MTWIHERSLQSWFVAYVKVLKADVEAIRVAGLCMIATLSFLHEQSKDNVHESFVCWRLPNQVNIALAVIILIAHEDADYIYKRRFET